MIESKSNLEKPEALEFTDKDFELNPVQQQEIGRLSSDISIEELSQNETLRNKFIEDVDKEVKLLKPKLNTAMALDRALHPTMEKFLKNLDSKYLEAPSDIKQIKQISDYLSLREDLKFENWKNLSTEQKVKLLNDLEKDIAKIAHRPALILQAAKMENGCWGKNYGNRMEINVKYLEESSVNERSYWETLDTLIHEGRHTYQNYNLTTRNIHSRPSEVESWRENHEKGYENGVREIPVFGLRYTNEQLQRGYRFQPVEIDARNFAHDTVTQLKEKWNGNIDIYESCITMEKTDIEQISFTGKYTDAEIRRLQRDVNDLGYKVSYAKSNVQHWQRCYDLSKSSGDLSRLNDAKSRLNYLQSDLKRATERLNNAR